MRSPLQNHPFPVEAFFESSLVLTYAAPVEELQHRIPECLALDTFQDALGFIAVAMVDTRGLRPRGFPSLFGRDFFLIGYRIFVRYTTNEGRRLRGLYILRSETDRRSMEFLGRIFTRYQYHRTDLTCRRTDGRMEVQAPESGFLVQVRTDQPEVSLPDGSPFANWKEARRFAGPLPFTFSYDSARREVLSVEGVRQDWKPQPVQVEQQCIPFLDTLGINQLTLANAFLVEGIPYHWKRGSTETWTP